MVKEDYCSYELSKLLKEKGFDEPCQSFYKLDSNEIYRGTVFTNTQIGDKFYNAPTLQMALKWLREVHKLHIEIYANASGYRFIISKTPPDGTDLVCDIEGTNDGGAWDDFGECADSAMKYCLTELIKGDEK